MSNFIVKYGKAAKSVLNEVLPRSGGNVNWKEFSSKHEISNNFGAALQRIGVVLKVKNGHYKSNVSDYYVSDVTAGKIASVLQKHKLMQFPHDANSIANAKAELVRMGIVRAPKPQVTQQTQPTQPKKQAVKPAMAPKPAQQPPVLRKMTITAVATSKDELTQQMLGSFTMRELVSEISRRLSKQTVKARANVAKEINAAISHF